MTHSKPLSKIYESEVVRRRSASEEYEATTIKIQKQLDTIHQLLSKHNEEQQGDQNNWGRTGELTKVSKELEDIIIFLGRGLY